MKTLHWYDTVKTAAHAVRGYDFVALYDEDFNETFRIVNIYGREWTHISLEGGGWDSPADIPTPEDRLRADVDYLTMENEALEGDMDQAKADIDYLLMITEEE